MAAGMAGANKATACCGDCGHFANVHHGGGGRRPGGSSCAAPDCDCQRVVEGIGARVPLGKDNLTAAEVGRLLGLSVHTLSLDPPMNRRWLSVGMRKVPSELG